MHNVPTLLYTGLLSDPSPIIGTHDCRLVDLIDVTLACEVANSNLFEVDTVADVDDEGRVGNSCCRFGN